MKKRIGIQGLLIFLAVATAILFSSVLIPPAKQPLNDVFYNVMGFTLILSGFFLRILARGYKSETSVQGNALSKAGIYSLIRNPMYLGTFVIGLGITTVLFVWWVFVIFAAVFFIVYLPQVRKEEGYLRQRFGQEYETYCKVTPRFLPNIRAFLKTLKQSRENPFIFKWAWSRKELSSLIAVLSGVLILELREDIHLFGSCQFAQELLALILAVGLFGLIILSFRQK